MYIRRLDFPLMLEAPVNTRDQIAIRLGVKMGLRPGEIRLVCKEDISFQTRKVRLDYCARTRPRTVPGDPETLELIEDYTADRNRGVILQPGSRYVTKPGEPLSRVSLWNICRSIAKAARIPHWKEYYPYLWRHFFAADWDQRKGNTNTLRGILGHQSLTTTTIYLSRLIFWENHLREYDRIKGETRKMNGNKFYEQYCINCIHRPVCRFLEEACQGSEWASGCDHYIPKTTLQILKEAQR